MTQYVVISRGIASGARGGGVKALRLRSDFTPRRDDAEAQRDHIERTEKSYAWIAEIIDTPDELAN